MSVPIPVERAAVATGEVAAPVGSKVTGTVNGAKESNCVELGVAAKRSRMHYPKQRVLNHL